MLSGAVLGFSDGCKLNRLFSPLPWKKFLLKYWCPLLVFLSYSFAYMSNIVKYLNISHGSGHCFVISWTYHKRKNIYPEVLCREVILRQLDILLQLVFLWRVKVMAAKQDLVAACPLLITSVTSGACLGG